MKPSKGRPLPGAKAPDLLPPADAAEHPTDRFARPLRDLRISVTDRCNFRCVYCMPRDVFGPGFDFLPRASLLTFEEIRRLAGVFVGLGVEKLRLTGGEPLLRRELDKLVALLAEIEGVSDLTMTTNASLLAGKVEALRRAGLSRITISLDALDDDVFRAMSDVQVPVRSVLDGIRAAEAEGLDPIKINMVVKRGANEGQILKMAEHFRGTGHILRFIEFMDVGNSNGWRMDAVVTAREIRDAIQTRWPLEPLEPNYSGEVANRYRYSDGAGEIGIIASVTRPFCGTCSRGRLTADGEFFTCLFAGRGHDLRGLLRDGASDSEISQHIREIWSNRGDRYSEIRSRATRELPRVEMSRIGG
jgi:GTP 3',8-cyclase